MNKNWGFGIMILGILTGFIGEVARFYPIWGYNPNILFCGFIILVTGIIFSLIGTDGET